MREFDVFAGLVSDIVFGVRRTIINWLITIEVFYQRLLMEVYELKYIIGFSQKE